MFVVGGAISGEVFGSVLWYGSVSGQVLAHGSASGCSIGRWKMGFLSDAMAVSSETGHNKTLLDHKAVVAKLNRMMNGWANYFCLGPVSKAYRAVDRHARKRLRQWLCAKHKMAGRATRQYPEATLHEAFGLICLTERTHSFSWAKP